MLATLRRRAAPPVAAVRELVANPGLLSLEFGSFAWMAAEGAYLVGLLVFAFDVGGTAAVAFVAVLRALPSVVLTPLILSLADRIARDSLLRLVVAVRVVCVAILTVLIAQDAAIPSIYLLAAIDAIAAALLRPLRATLIPALARSPGELVAANVATTTGDGLAALLAPTLAAVLLAAGSIAATFVAGTIAMVVALGSTLRISAARSLPQDPVGPGDATAADQPARPRAAPLGVLRELLELRHARLVVACFVGQRLVRGMLAVLVVAASFEVLGLGQPGVGWLTAAIGLGGFVGGVVALGLVGSRSLARAFAAGLVAWGGGILLAGVIPNVGVVLAFLALAGVGKVGVDVAGVSLLQRTVPADRRGRIFGLLEGMISAALALGPILASFLVDRLGPGGAIVVGGAVPLVLVAASWPVLRSADAAAVLPEPAFQLLSNVPMFRPLQLTTIEQLAVGARRETADPGEAIIREGDPGRTFYIVESGRLEALVDGRPTIELGPGDSFGEIALVRDTNRTATVRAVEPSALVVLDRELFLAAVTSHSESIAAADAVIGARLAGA
ncbi:MAG: cyclic nucleotide-binding domain-containing protein [Chloroflexota bacterium]